MRSGLSPAYGCSNGTCGDCLARVVEGETAAARFSDYPIRDADRAAGAVLLCACVPRTDLVLEVREAAGAEDIPPQSVRARVHETVDLGGARALRLKVIRGAALRFLAGQHVRVGVRRGLAVEHALASCPCDAVNLELHLDPAEGPAQQALAALARNEKVTVDGPFGGITLDEASGRPLLFVCAGTGFGPVKGIVEHVINRELDLPLRLIRVEPGGASPYLHNYCRSWADAFEDFVYGVADRGHEALARALHGEALAAFDAYLSGPPAFLEQAARSLELLGCDRARVFAAPPCVQS